MNAEEAEETDFIHKDNFKDEDCLDIPHYHLMSRITTLGLFGIPYLLFDRSRF